MENKTQRGGKRLGAGRPKKEKQGKKFQIIAYSETIQAIKEFKKYCADNDLDFVEELNKAINDSLIN